MGHDIVVGAGQYAPGTARGRQLLAHVMQQRSAGADGAVRRKPAPRQMFHFTITPTAPMDVTAWRVLVCTRILGADAATAA